MIMCQSRPLELSRTVRVLLADRPQFRHSEHSERQRLWTNLKFEGRTVRTPGTDRPPFTSCNPPETKTSLDKKRISLRTVRAPRADRPMFTFQPKPEKQPLWYKSEISRWTVRAPWVDCPPFNFEAHQRDTLSGTFFEIKWRAVRPPGPDRPRAHQRLCKLSGMVADCPPLVCGLSTVTQSALNLSCFPKLININSNSFSFANVPTLLCEHHHVHVC